MWKTLSSKEIYKHPRIKLIEDEVLLPNGHLTQYLRLDYYGEGASAVTIICKRNDGKILVEKEYAYPINKKIFQFPGGTVPKGESISKRVNRELMEEVDMKADKLMLLGSYFPYTRRSDAKFYVYLATQLQEKSLEGDPEEDIELFWFSEQEIDNMIKIGEIIHGQFLSAWAIYKTHQ